ncbi:hypothetical protein ACFX13_041636 [Malus domestica]
MDDTLDAAFWLPTQILNDDDAPAMELNSKTKKSGGYGFDTDAPKALFPFEFPYGSAFGVSSDFSSPVESSETESDEEDYLVGLTRQMARSTLDDEFKYSDSPFAFEKPKVAASHLGSAACGCRGSSQDVHQPKQRPPGSSKKAFPNSNPARSKCLSGNPIDDCWRCEDWSNNHQRLADCGIGFGMDALGGKGGLIYIVTDSSDSNPANPTSGTFHHAVIQNKPLWIIFSTDMTIKLKYELIVNSFKTIDCRGVNVHVTGGGCITLQYVSNIIIHNIHVHHCKPAGNTNIVSSPTHVGWRGKSDGDGISLIAALKRAQAHQRRGCIEQQQPLLTIKVELEQLIIFILDDPSVSRVMREAGFSSTNVKNNLKESSTSSVFQCYSSSANSSSPPTCERTKQVLADDVVTNPEKMADWCLQWRSQDFSGGGANLKQCKVKKK